MNEKKKIILGISGASGAIYGVRMLEELNAASVETHLIISKAARITISQEVDITAEKLSDKAHTIYSPSDISASISSGSFLTSGMIIAPCSVKTLAEIATGVTTSLIGRAADVILKERRPLLLMVREAPFHSVHLEHMLTLSRMGAIIAPPVPAFYNKPSSIDDIVNHTVGRALDIFSIKSNLVKRWSGVDKRGT